jgi:hypothetical protein
MRRASVGALALTVARLAAAAAGEDGRAHPLVAGAGSSAMPAWSADGRVVVFHARRLGEREEGVPTRNVWRVGADGDAERRLTNGTKDEYHASLSPDGRRLLFVSERNGSRDVWVADADGQNPVPLTDDPGTEDQPAWSADSARIAYAAFPKEGGSFDLWVVQADGGGRRRLTTTAANEIFPAWHPSGETLAYVTDAGGTFDLYALGVRDGDTRPLVVSPDHEARPAWSPDGAKIAFSRWPGRGRAADATLWLANADGTAPIELTAAPKPATHPAWAPDGRRLAFQHGTDAGWQIWVLGLPSDLAESGRLRLAQQVRGGADVDTAELRGGGTRRGLLRERRVRIRAPYGALDLPRTTVASIVFGGGERELARVVLANGDRVTGLLEADVLHLVAGARTDRLAVAQLAQLSLRRRPAPSRGGGFRALMRNGDSLLVSEAFGPLRLRVGTRALALGAAQIERVEFAETGDRARVVLAGGDGVSGELTGDGPLGLVLALGPRLDVHPSSVRALVRTAAPGRASRSRG